ncbi:hypothetical protein ACQFYA_18800 [Promicromonospora sp. Marseille-Q5078]
MRQNVLVSSTALLWGLQYAFLNPALALYNVSGLVASLLIPARADRSRWRPCSRSRRRSRSPSPG